jgi:hypothetical protein
MFRQRYTLFCPDPRSTLVPVHSSPNLCARRLPRPRRDGGVYPEQLGAFSFPLAMPIAKPPSVSHPTHSEANASLLCSTAPARHVGPGHAANRLDFSRCSLCEQKKSNSRANNALIFNNLQTHELLTPLNSCTYKIGGGISLNESTFLELPHIDGTHLSAHALCCSARSTFTCRLLALSVVEGSTLQVQSPRSTLEPISSCATISLRGTDER